jgi:hypothetical protein
MAIELFQVLSVQSTRQWHDIVTLDESCIYLFSEYDLMWAAPGEIVVDREQHTVQSPKCMLTVAWNPIGFHVLKALPKGRKFNAQYDVIIQMMSWSQSQIGGGRPGEHGRTSCGCILVMLGHTPRKCQGITSVISPPLFARFGTLGLFVFGYVKGKLMGYHSETPSELLVRIRVILAEIWRETLNAVFLEWME